MAKIHTIFMRIRIMATGFGTRGIQDRFYIRCICRRQAATIHRVNILFGTSKKQDGTGKKEDEEEIAKNRCGPCNHGVFASFKMFQNNRTGGFLF